MLVVSGRVSMYHRTRDGLSLCCLSAIVVVRRDQISDAMMLMQKVYVQKKNQLSLLYVALVYSKCTNPRYQPIHTVMTATHATKRNNC